MSQCPFHPQLDAYHDGELAPEAARQLEQHLRSCASCSAELAEMRGLSTKIAAAAGPARIDADESRRLHAAIHLASNDDSSRPLLRTAGMLLALAASILIISGVWLMELRPAARQPAQAGVAVSAEWERVAVNLRADPRLEGVNLTPDFPFSHDYLAVWWMIDALTPPEQMPWVKPGSF